MAAQKKFEPEDIYPAIRRGYIPASKHGALITASEERIRAKLAGVEPDSAKVGSVGDIKIGAAAIAETMNRLCHEEAGQGTVPHVALRREREAHRQTKAQLAALQQQLSQS